MPLRVALSTAALHYGAGMMLHTAASGAVPALHEVYLRVERDGALAALGSVRVNIAYLTHVPEADAVAAIRRLVERLDWRRDFGALLASLPPPGPDLPAMARALVECALEDGLARSEGRPLAARLGGAFSPAVVTCQSLFWAPDDETLRRAEAFVARGFRHLKLRLGVETFERDLARLAALRDRVGPDVTLAADANGAWSPAEAPARLAALAPYRLAYVEQPIPPGDLSALARVATASPLPVMADESAASGKDVEAIARSRAVPLAHLKIVKLGGVRAVADAARRLTEAGVGVMIGQMNEGGLGTAAAAHAAMAVAPAYCELYGADGLVDDPASGYAYRGGALRLPEGPGLGLDFDEARTAPLWEARA